MPLVQQIVHIFTPYRTLCSKQRGSLLHLDEIEKSVYMVRKMAVLGRLADADPVELKEYVRVISSSAEILPRLIDQAVEGAK